MCVFFIIILLLFLLFTGLISSVLWRDRRSGPPEYYFMLLVVWNRRLRISLMIWLECSHELYNQCSIDRCERNQSISVCGRKPKRHQERCDYRRKSQRDTEASCGPSVHGFSFHFFFPFFFSVCLLFGLVPWKASTQISAHDIPCVNGQCWYSAAAPVTVNISIPKTIQEIFTYRMIVSNSN